MKRFRIKTLEKFETNADYTVEGDDSLTVEAAIAQVVAGYITPDRHDHPGHDDEFIEVLDVKVEKEAVK